MEADQIKQSGWRQGSILPQQLVDRLILEGQIPAVICTRSPRWSKVLALTPGFIRRILSAFRLVADRNRAGATSRSDLWMVLSHDCDVSNADFAKEPLVELIRITRMHAPQNDIRDWKNPRALEIIQEGTRGPVAYLIGANDRVVIDRRHLSGHAPVLSPLNLENIRRIAGWFARRYTRPAFADTFNERTKDASAKLRKRLRKRGDVISGIWFVVSDEELPAGQDYTVQVCATMRVEDFVNSESRTTAQELLGHIESELASCDGIDVVGAELRSEADFTLHDLHTSKRWDFDELSLRTGSVADIPPNSGDA